MKINFFLIYQLRDGKLEVKIFIDESIEIKDNYFSQFYGKTDFLKVFDYFFNVEYRYILKELIIVWYMYGGSDFFDIFV